MRTATNNRTYHNDTSNILLPLATGWYKGANLTVVAVMRSCLDDSAVALALGEEPPRYASSVATSPHLEQGEAEKWQRLHQPTFHSAMPSETASGFC